MRCAKMSAKPSAGSCNDVVVVDLLAIQELFVHAVSVQRWG